MKIKSNKGFSLIEILVAVSITSLMIVTLAQMMSVVSKSWLEGLKRVDNYSKARATMDLLSRDLQSGIFRPDLGAFVDDVGESKFTFFAKRPGIGGDRRMSLAYYKMDEAKGVLIRSSEAVLWSVNPNQISFYDPNPPAPNPIPVPKIAFFDETNMTDDPVAEGVLRFEYYFIDVDGKYRTTYYDTSSPAKAAKAVGVVVAVMDQQTLKLMKSNFAAKLATLTSALPSGAFPALTKTNLNDGKRYQTEWDTLMNDASFFIGMPSTAKTGIRIMERVIYLP